MVIKPKAVDKITLRNWQDLDWRDPYTDLVNLGKLQASFDQKGIAVTADDLRVRELRRFHEQKQAALFAYFISFAILKAPIAYAMVEAEDYDCVLWSKEGGKAEGRSQYSPVQLKEVVPHDRNPKASIEGELAKLEKYVTSENTIVAVHINQTGSVVYSDIQSPKTSIGEIWLYSALAADQSLWFLYGDLTGSPHGYEIPWPMSPGDKTKKGQK